MLLVTHDALDALTLADEVLVLDEGRVVQTGSPREVAAHPRTEHVARLVGLNVVREGDDAALLRPERGHRLPPRRRQRARPRPRRATAGPAGSRRSHRTATPYACW